MNAHAWLGVQGRHLAAFEAVARLGSVTRAAEELGYAQPAVSQQLGVLERRLGTTLLHRPGPGRAPTLTQAGEALLPRARALLAALEDARMAVADAQAGLAGRVRVGTFQSASERLLPAILAALAASHPSLLVEVVEDVDDDALEARVLDGRLDLAFSVAPVTAAGLVEAPVAQDPYRLLVSRDSPLAARASVHLAEVAELPLVGLRSCRAQAQVEERARAAGHALRIGPRHDEHGLIHGRVASGSHAALLPALAIQDHHPGVRAVPLDPPLPPRVIVLAHREVTPAAGAFLAAAGA